MFSNEQLLKKWQPVLEHADLPQIKDTLRKSVTAQLLENTERSMKEQGGMPRALLEAYSVTNDTGTAGFGDGVANYDPVLISLVRRSMPNLVAYDICGVQQ